MRTALAASGATLSLVLSLAWVTIAHAGMGSDVDVPLDHSDKRLGKFDVKSLSGMLYQPPEAGARGFPAIRRSRRSSIGGSGKAK